MDDHPDLEFDHMLADRLGWQSVAAMRRDMSMAEWQAWAVFIGRERQRQELANARARG